MSLAGPGDALCSPGHFRPSTPQEAPQMTAELHESADFGQDQFDRRSRAVATSGENSQSEPQVEDRSTVISPG